MTPLQYFDISEFDCQETGNNKMNPYFLDKLDNLRAACGFPFKVTSGYRDPAHSIEARKAVPGTHADGIAADIAIQDGAQRGLIVRKAIELGFKGIGVAKTFVHVDTRNSDQLIMWSY